MRVTFKMLSNSSAEISKLNKRLQPQAIMILQKILVR